MKARGRTPRSSETAKQRPVMVRLSGALHARLCEQRQQLGKSLNVLIIEAIDKALSLAVASSAEQES
jgi:predicted HicB family RNase H-like nuclease